ncbi:MAG TPA: hypothetical protein VFQ19_12415, partial [Nocardioidaceae bacterium]|nr:hypothetical protein [Nocardioidaceae bacterium]
RTGGVRHMWNPWTWAAMSNQAAVVNARSATIEMSRRRVEHEEVALFLEDHAGRVTKSASA